MKKISFLIVFITTFLAYGYSQSLQLSNGQGIIPNNSEIIQVATPDSSLMSTIILVKNISSASVNVLCKKIEYKLQDSTEVTMCWAGGCYPANVFVSPNFQPLAPGETNSEFLGHYNVVYPHPHFVSGESVIRWTFYNKANVSDSASVLVKYTSYPLGVPGAVKPDISSIYPNPASDHARFTITLPAGNTGELLIRDMVGKTVFSKVMNLTENKITLNTAGLAEGIYFCTLVTEGNMAITRKLVVRH